MKKKYVPVRMPDDILVRVKKMAGDQGRSVSETVGILIVKSLESSPESGPTIDLETIKKEVDLAIRLELEPALKVITLLRSEISGLSKSPALDHGGTDPVSVQEIRPEVVRFLGEKVARIDALLVGVSAKISGKSVEAIRKEISAELSKSPAAGPSGGGPGTIRFLSEKVARFDALLVRVSTKISGSNVGDHGDRMKQANIMAQHEIEKLYGN